MLARAGYGHFDDIMEWTPRRIGETVRLNHKLHTRELREQLVLHTMAARGDPKAIQKALKDDP